MALSTAGLTTTGTSGGGTVTANTSSGATPVTVSSATKVDPNTVGTVLYQPPPPSGGGVPTMGATLGYTENAAQIKSYADQLTKIDSYAGTSADTADMEEKKRNLTTALGTYYGGQLQYMSTQAGASTQPGMAALLSAINSGKLTWEQAGQYIANGQDPSTLSDADLAKGVDAAIQKAAKDKAAQFDPAKAAAGTNAAMGDALQQAATLGGQEAAASQQFSNIMDSANKYAQSQINGSAGIKAADATENANLSKVSSEGVAASQYGGAMGAAVTENSAASMADQYASQRNNLQQDTTNSVQKFIQDQLQGGMSSIESLTTMPVEARMQMQKNAANSLLQQTENAVQNGDENAQNQVAQLKQKIADWQTHLQDQGQSDKLWSDIVNIGAGVLMTAAGVVATVYTGGAAAPLIAAGVGQTVNGIRQA